MVSKTLRRVSLNALKTVHHLNLNGFSESVTDGVVCLTLVPVTSENLRLVNLMGYRNISAGDMEDILQYVSLFRCRRGGRDLLEQRSRSAACGYASASRFGSPLSAGPVCASQIDG